MTDRPTSDIPASTAGENSPASVAADPSVVQHYFTGTGEGIAAAKETPVRLAGEEFTVLTGAGVFSSGHIDGGTAVLLRKAPNPPPTGTFLDIGCGWGVLALTLGLLSPDATIWAIDVNPEARELTRANAERLGLPNITVAEPSGVPPDLRFDLIWSNPPIRIGKAQVHELLSQWLQRLTDDGQAWLVVQRHLGADPLTAWLNSNVEGIITTKQASAKGFRVLASHR